MDVVSNLLMSIQQPVDNTNRSFGIVFTAVGAITCPLFSAIGLLAMNSASTLTLDCRRLEPTQGTCELTTVYGPFKRQGDRQQFSLKELQKAQLDEMTPEPSDTESNSLYRIVLLVRNEQIPISGGYDSDENWEQCQRYPACIDSGNQQYPTHSFDRGNPIRHKSW
jgi:hypothetical protein